MMNNVFYPFAGNLNLVVTDIVGKPESYSKLYSAHDIFVQSPHLGTIAGSHDIQGGSRHEFAQNLGFEMRQLGQRRLYVTSGDPGFDWRGKGERWMQRRELDWLVATIRDYFSQHDPELTVFSSKHLQGESYR